MDPRQLGKLVVVAGVVLAALGALLWGGLLAWFGHLPGDIRVVGERTRVYVPITSMLVVSAGLTLVLWLVRKLGGGS
jgi:hypothetical protein